MTRPAVEPAPRDVINAVAVTSILAAAATFVPLLGLLGAFVIPLPVVYYRVKLGRRAGAIVPGAVLLIVAVLHGGLSADWLFFSELLVLGFALGEAYAADLPVEHSVLLAVGAVAGSAVTALAIYSMAAGSGPLTVIQGYVDRNIQMSLAVYENIGIDETTLATIRKALEEIRPWLVRLVPTMVLTASLFVTWTTILLSRPLLRLRGLAVPGYGSLNRWKTPEGLVWAVIGCGAALLLPVEGLKTVALNGLPVLMTIYFFQGIAIVSYYAEKKGLPAFVRILLYSFIGVQRLMLLVVVALGFFDVWLNFRKLESGENG